MAAVALYVLWRRLEPAAWPAALEQLRSFPLSDVLAGASLAALSFMLLGVYEAAMLRELGRFMGRVRPLVIALCASAIGHALGLATLSGGALRYRFYSAAGLSKTQIGALVALSAMPFVLGISTLLSVALLFRARQASSVLHLPAELLLVVGALGVALNIGYLLLTAARRNLVLGRFSLTLPRPGFALQQLSLGVAEIFCVAGLLYWFMPPETGLGPLGFVIVYLLAVMMGQLSSVPAGLGVLEASLLLLLPQAPAPKVLAAVLAYRLLFEVVPLLIALVLYLAHEGRLRWRAAHSSR